jgi:hypothetical protein
MTPLFKRLNLKDQTEIVVLNAPDSFESELEALSGVEVLDNYYDADEIKFALVFVTTQDEIDQFAGAIAKLATRDAVIWFAYPKFTSKIYKCEFDRDTGWEPLGKLGFEGVRQVQIHADWEALRFRQANKESA